MKYIKFCMLLAFVSLCCIVVSAQSQNSSSNSRIVTLVVSGDGSTKDEAINNALRSAIEQAFGTFVSANTSVINDELVRDEIVTVSSGNIQNYKEISSMEVDGIKNVTLQATVSIGKLVSYAQNKGMQTELAGATFAMNKKIKQLNKANEKKAMDHLMEQLDQISRQGLYDYRIETSDPRNSNKRGYNKMDVIITASFNENGRNYIETLRKTLSSLSLTSQEQEEYDNSNEQYVSLKINGESYYLRNTIEYMTENAYPLFTYIAYPIVHFVNKSLFNFVVKDNLGNNYSLAYKEDRNFDFKAKTNRERLPSANFINKMDYWDQYNYEQMGNKENYKAYHAFKQGKWVHIYFAYYPYARIDNPEFWQTHCFAPYGINDDKYKIRLSKISSHDELKFETEVKFSLVANYSDDQLMNLTGIFVEPIK